MWMRRNGRIASTDYWNDRRTQSPPMSRRRKETLADVLMAAPWWVSVILGIVGFVALRYVIPASGSDNPIFHGLAQGTKPLAPFVAIACGVLAVLSAIGARHRRKVVDETRNLDALRALSWQDFEVLVGEAFRRDGYAMLEAPKGGADGGVDLVMSKDSRKHLIQCKQWRNRSVGEPIIREQFGILTHEGADEAVVITSGSFTPGALAFARGKPMRLIDGPELLELVKSVQPPAAAPLSATAPDPQPVASNPSCPTCGKSMVMRTARRGSNAGSHFWGCPDFPRCRGTRPA